MGKYKQPVITTAGYNLIAQAVSGGASVEWTTMQTSTYIVPDGADIAAMTSLQDVMQTASITSSHVYDGDVVQVSANFDNTEIAVDYLVQTLGVFARVASADPVLVAVVCAEDPDSVPVFDINSPSSFLYNLQLTISGASAVTFSVNPTGTATVQDISDIREDIEEINDQLSGDPYQMVYIKGDASGLAWQNMCVTPEMFGAVGDGTHDDTTSLQSAVNYGFSNKIAVYLTKSYLITSPLVIKGISATVTNKGSVLLGNGSARIIAGATLTHVVETAPGADDTRAYGITVKDITIDGVNQATDGFYSGYAFAGCVLENVIIRRCTNGLHINGNCYLNNFTNVRTSYCTSYGIYFEGGNNTSNVFNKCYVETSENAYRINGQYCSMISCCADSITGTVFTFVSFNGTLVGCGSEARNFTCMFDVSNNSKVNVIGGMFWGNPNLAEYYIRVSIGSYLGIKGCRINNTTSEMQSGALCSIGANSGLNLEKVTIYKDFPGENYISGTGSLYNNTAIYTKAMEVTLDENNEVDIGLNPKFSSVLSVYVTGRTGWVAIPYNYNNVTTKVMICTRSEWFPTISDKNFTFTVRYIRNSQI